MYIYKPVFSGYTIPKKEIKFYKLEIQANKKQINNTKSIKEQTDTRGNDTGNRLPRCLTVFISLLNAAKNNTKD